MDRVFQKRPSEYNGSIGVNIWLSLWLCIKFFWFCLVSCNFLTLLDEEIAQDLALKYAFDGEVI